MKKNLIYTTTEINKNFRIKVFGYNAEGKKINTLMGVAGILALIGEELLNKFLRRAFSCMEDVCVCNCGCDCMKCELFAYYMTHKED